MKKVALLALITIAAPAMADTIAESKLKPAKTTIATSLTNDQAVRCLRTSRPYDAHALNEISNDDGSTDIAVTFSGTRAGLWTFRPGEAGTIVEGREMWGARKPINRAFFACLMTQNRSRSVVSDGIL